MAKVLSHPTTSYPMVSGVTRVYLAPADDIDEPKCIASALAV